MTDPTTTDERRRAAEWLRERAARMFQMANVVDQPFRRELWAQAEAMLSAADAYEKGEQP